MTDKAIWRTKVKTDTLTVQHHRQHRDRCWPRNLLVWSRKGEDRKTSSTCYLSDKCTQGGDLGPQSLQKKERKSALDMGETRQKNQ